ncbi:MAG: TRAP transporter small permease [Hydrogenophaga sp.]|uniref:TRAP transporter small permease n=1 Tax=Hydrogenophaga sp. TaxID=1904254 RepID=UPI001DAF8ED9|nr:TRAP transporter small permease [Hydrogenophaga sp.]MBX3609358.1 TRAP transporter small permease [Hydrogenophaga sp.]
MKLLDHLEEWIMSLMLLAMTSLAFMQVVNRYVFNSGFSWTLELTTICFAIMIFVGISYGVRVGSHIGVDALVKLLPSRGQRIAGAIVVVLCLVYVGFVMTGATQYVSKMYDVGIEFEDLPIERWKVLIVMPIGYALVAYRFLQILWNLITGKTSSLHLADEAADALKLKAEGDAP